MGGAIPCWMRQPLLFLKIPHCENVDCGDAAVTKVLAQISICLFLDAAHCRATGEYINIHGGFSVKSPQKHDSHQIMIYASVP